MDLQPWISSRNPLGPVWMDALFAAIDDGFVGLDEIAQAQRNGWFRPGVLWQAEHRERDAARLPLRCKLAEAMYTQPHKPPFLVRRRQQLARVPASLARRVTRLLRGDGANASVK